MWQQAYYGGTIQDVLCSLIQEFGLKQLNSVTVG